MPDDRTPAPADAAKAPSLTDREANRQFGEGRAPRADRPSGEGGAASHTSRERLPNVGDAHAPTSADDIEDRPDKTLYDRLADKDVTPTEEGGGI